MTKEIAILKMKYFFSFGFRIQQDVEKSKTDLLQAKKMLNRSQQDWTRINNLLNQ